ncbi:unnamed protein product [Brassica oleracea]|uniref:(rape) hypothetical protein n=1 Tax=Brassica napus TaxID=3708 RepID=A0A816PQ49_BRANA|nr:unnamed protein product [Brassica napus]
MLCGSPSSTIVSTFFSLYSIDSLSRNCFDVFGVFVLGGSQVQNTAESTVFQVLN